MAEQTSYSNKTPIVPKEQVIFREYFHVILLIDSSGSMLFPFLKDVGNWSDENSDDYKNAIYQTQKSMTEAHKKALTALRGTQECKDCFLLVHQYTFNSTKHRLNEAEELSSENVDRVIEITSENYTPYNGTALYNTIHEALSVVYERHLKAAYEQQKRQDKVVLAVITDGMDTVITDERMKKKKIEEIKLITQKLRTNSHLHTSVLIGLTSQAFTIKELKNVKTELGFDEAISVEQNDERAIRRALQMASFALS
jgi:hypothetical protein